MRALAKASRATSKEFALVVSDKKAAAELPRLKGIKRFTPSSDLFNKYHNIFVWSSLSELPKLSSFIREANSRHYLRAVFVRDEWNSRMLPQFLYEANLRTLRNLMVHSDWKLPARVINAYRIGAEDALIAEAEVVEDHLMVVSCAGKRFDVPLESLKVFRDLEPGALRGFQVTDDGSYVSWPDAGIDIDLEIIKTVLDPSLIEERRLEAIQSDIRFGKAVALMRESSNLRQSDIPGLSDRQVRRIESGQRASLDSLKALASAHGMTVNTYLEKTAELASQLSS